MVMMARELDAAALDAAAFAAEQKERDVIAEIGRIKVETVSAVRSGLPELANSKIKLANTVSDLSALSEASESSYGPVSGRAGRLTALCAQKRGLEDTIELLDRMLELDRREDAAAVALEGGEYEAAVQHARSLTMSVAAAGDAFTTASRTRVEQLRKQVLGAIRKELRVALERRDDESVGRFCRLQVGPLPDIRCPMFDTRC